MLAGGLASNYGPVNTFGWDSVFTLRLPQVNAEIEKEKSSPQSFDQTVEGGYRAKAKFKPWRIGTSGDGELIHLHIGLEDIKTFQGDQSTTLKSAVAPVQVRLRFVPTSPTLLMASDEIEYKLVVETEPEAPLLMAGGFGSVQKAAQLLQMQYKPGEELHSMDDAILRTCLEQWLNDNLKEFAHVFATVNIANRVGDGAFDWLKPKETKYAFLGADTEEESQLAILCVSRSQDIDHLYATVAPGALPSEEESAAFVISGERFLDDFMRQALPVAFPGVQATDARLSDDKKELVIDRVTRLQRTSQESKDYDIDLLYLSIAVDGGTITVTSHTECQIDNGVYSECSSVSSYRMKLVKNGEGEDTLTFELIGEPDEHNSTRYDKGVEIRKWFVRIIGLIVAVTLVVLTDGLALIFSSVAAALVFGLLEFAPDIIGLIGKNAAPGLKLLAANATKAFRWAGGKVFELTDVTFNGSLILSGKLA